MIKNFTCKVKPFQNLKKLAEDIAAGKPQNQLTQTDFGVKIEFVADQATAQKIVQYIHEVAKETPKE